MTAEVRIRGLRNFPSPLGYWRQKEVRAKRCSTDHPTCA